MPNRTACETTINADGTFETIHRPFTVEEEAAADATDAAYDAKRPERMMAELRIERNAKLAESDWTQYNDSPLTDEAKSEWINYRQSLRDLPASTEDPADPTWPEAPSE